MTMDADIGTRAIDEPAPRRSRWNLGELVRYDRRAHGTGFDLVMVAPALVLFGLFIVWPALDALYSSLFDAPTRGGGFIGLANYAEMMTDGVFWIAMKNNLLFIACNLVFQVGVGTVFAALMDRGIRRGSTLIRTIIFAPLVVAPVAIGVIWSMILEPNFGLLAQAGDKVGLEVPSQGFLGNPSLAFYAIVAVGAWNYIGFMMMIMLAAMQAIPRDLYEAAELDGASAIQSFLHITLPSVKQALILCALIVVVGSFKTFDLVYVLTDGGPGNTTQVLGTYIVESAFGLFRPNYAAAMSVVVLIVAFAFGTMQIFASQKGTTR